MFGEEATTLSRSTTDRRETFASQAIENVQRILDRTNNVATRLRETADAAFGSYPEPDERTGPTPCRSGRFGDLLDVIDTPDRSVNRLEAEAARFLPIA